MDFGDTQPLPSQVVRDYLSARARANSKASQLETYADGDTGFVDLAGFGADGADEVPPPRDPSPASVLSSQDARSLPEKENSPDELSQDSGMVDGNVNVSSTKSEKTSTLAGKKHGRDGTVIENGSTPSKDIAAMFDAGRELQPMGMTQLFQNTQATSSPTSPKNLRSDPVFARPSPLLRSANRSTPPPSSSSPSTTRKIERPKQTVDPQDVYMPIDESQKQRIAHEHTNGMMMSSPNNSDSEGAEWDEDPRSKAEAQKRRMRRIDKLAKRDFQSLGATASRTRDKSYEPFAAQTVIGLVTPRAGSKEVIMISSESKENEQAISDHDDSPDEYDELSQSVPMSNHKTPRDRLSTSSRSWSVRAKKAHHARPNSSPVGGKYANTPSRLMDLRQQNIGSQNFALPQASNEHTPLKRVGHPGAFVENSQPGERLVPVGPPPRPVLPSSITSRGIVSQSEIPSCTDNMDNILDVGAKKDSNLESSSIPAAPHLGNSCSEIRSNSGRIVTPASSPPGLASKGRGVETAREDVDGYQLRNQNDRSSTELRTSGRGESQKMSEATENSKENYPPPRVDRGFALFGEEPTIPETSPITVSVGEHQSKTTAPKTINEGGGVNGAENHPNFGPRSTKSSGEISQFHTAPSRQEGLISGKPWSSNPPISSNTPERARYFGTKKMIDIANQQSPSAATSVLDFDELSILNDEDHQYHRAVAGFSPTLRSRKRFRPLVRSRRGSNNNRHSPRKDPVSPLVAEKEIQAKDKTSLVENEAAVRKEPEHIAYNMILGTDTKEKTNHTHTSRKTQPVPALNLSKQQDGKEQGQQLASKVAEAFDVHSGLSNEISRLLKPTQEHSGLREPASEAQTASTTSNHNSRAITDGMRYPERVLARFNGLNPAYYPATLIGPADNSATALTVRFDDGSSGSVEQHLIKRLEFHEGDLVKLDRSGMKSTIFVVCGLTNRPADEKEAGEEGRCDVYGHRGMILKPKQRRSLPMDTTVRTTEIISTGIENVYLTSTLWPRLKDRNIKPWQTAREDMRTLTPLDRRHTPSTPSSRTRNKAAPSFPGSLPSVNSPTKSFESHSGYFSNMAFCVSFSGEKEEEKAFVSQLILENGGQILPEGFEQLFETAASTATSPLRSTKQQAINQAVLHPSKAAANLGFVALICDSYSRRAKYMQALALNVPCLHGRWIINSVEEGSLQPWTPYLLPSGECALLKGAIRSRVLGGSAYDTSTSPENLKFEDLFAHRPRFFEEKRIILVIGTGKVGERRAIYSFLMKAANATIVEKARDLPTAKSLLVKGDQWDFIVVEDSRVVDARAKLHGNVATKPDQRKGRKGNRDTDVGLALDKHRVISDEIILQSLIAGMWMG